MVRRARNERGITIIETTVMLSVLFILAGAMSPIVSESITTARAVKAQNDASMIAMGLINLQKDLGADASAFSAVAAAAETGGLPEMLATAGNSPALDEADNAGTLEPVVALFSRAGGSRGGNGSGAGYAQRRRWREVSAGSLDDHLLTNRRGYRYRRPGEYGGWNGPYLSTPVKSDPWGNQFMVNLRWLDGGSTVADSEGRPRRAVFVVSAGANGVIETPFEQPITDARAFGDDVVIRIQ